ncbi:MAG TPA: hypothetical protein VHW24_22590 [Bryobacteraceae bacterium]|jgi:hypothetical protein|nr:hypothetical protein [Bryobacteraceae bacterium]
MKTTTPKLSLLYYEGAGGLDFGGLGRRIEGERGSDLRRRADVQLKKRTEKTN